ncbi:low molecular weight phosphatase family protein [Patescibacteria group bacterium]|nr:low molecular weight phosphatase family protein [Patescibacteria group bacterium]MBU4512483.1 low molecular weight phosphatase family protein [Patescibacteria group bacterium]
MEILFICRANVGRSQMAPAFFNRLSKKHKAVGAGTHVDNRCGEPLHPFVVQCMSEVGYDLSKNTRKQLTPKMVKNTDKIIVITEKENLPDYVDLSKVVFWEIDDAKDKSLEFHRQIRDQIKSLVEKLVKEIG